MSLIRWHAPYDVEKWFEDMLPGSGRSGFVPAIDLFQTNDAVVVKTPLPGIDAKDVSISVENDVLTIEGTTEQKTEVDEEHYFRKEIRNGSFHRSVALPVAVDGEKADAALENGILTITIPKEERAKPKNVQVRVVKNAK